MSELTEIQRALGRIEGALEAIQNAMDKTVDRLNSHDTRVRVLEDSSSKSAGYTSAISGLSGLFAGAMGAWVARHF